MRTLQLRQYQIIPGLYDDFMEWWQSVIIPVRNNAGFQIDFAVGNKDENQFTWVVSVAGDQAKFEEIEAEYLKSDARTAAFADQPQRVAEMKLCFVESFI